jgi:nicotinamide mononucleotide transporter
VLSEEGLTLIAKVAFICWGAQVTWLELIAFIAALAMVYFNIRVNFWGWPLAAFSSLLYGMLFWQSKLYAEALLQVFFIVLAFWGLWQWLKGTQFAGQPLRVRNASLGLMVICSGIFLGLWGAIAGLLIYFTDSQVAWWDALPTAGSVIAQWLLGRKYIQNWPVWVAVNLVSLGLFAYKGLWLTVLLYSLFACLSFAGWRAWRQLTDQRVGLAS